MDRETGGKSRVPFFGPYVSPVPEQMRPICGRNTANEADQVTRKYRNDFLDVSLDVVVRLLLHFCEMSNKNLLIRETGMTEKLGLP